MSLVQRFSIILVSGIFNAHLFDLGDYQFWVIAVLNGIILTDFKKYKDEQSSR